MTEQLRRHGRPPRVTLVEPLSGRHPGWYAPACVVARDHEVSTAVESSRRARGACSNASKCKLPTTHNHHHHHHHHHLLLHLLLKVFIVARAIFKRRDPGAAENGAEDLLGFLNTAMKHLATNACPHACP